MAELIGGLAYDPEGLPLDAELKCLVQEGMTFEKITDEVHRRTGLRFNGATLAVAVSRAALTETTGHRYRDCIPWRVRPQHALAYSARMLRLLGRQRSGLPVDPLSADRLDGWLRLLDREGVVIGYCPNDPTGIVYLDRRWRDGPNIELPVRVKPLRLEWLARTPSRFHEPAWMTAESTRLAELVSRHLPRHR